MTRMIRIHSLVLALLWLWTICLNSSSFALAKDVTCEDDDETCVNVYLETDDEEDEDEDDGDEDDEDEDDSDEDDSDEEENEYYEEYEEEEEDTMAVNVKWGTVQTFPANQPEVMQVIEDAIEYMDNEVSKSDYDDIRDKCLLLHSDCAQWANSGECLTTPKYMFFHCAPVCQTCHVLRQSSIDGHSSPVMGNPERRIEPLWESLSELTFSLNKPDRMVDRRKRFTRKGDSERVKMQSRRSREAQVDLDPIT